MSGNWKIVVGEEPLSALGPIDETLMDGREFTHSFLAIVDDKGIVQEEMHGRAARGFDKILNNLTNTIRQYFNLASTPPDQVVRTRDGEKLKVFLDTPAADRDHGGRVFTTVTTGTKDEIEDYWHKALERGLQINALDADYLAIGIKQRPGQNCHAVTATVLRCLGFDAVSISAAMSINFMRPGFERHLPDTDDDIKNTSLPCQDIRHHLKQSTIEFTKDKSVATVLKSKIKAALNV